jgi:hypothetical protein
MSADLMTLPEYITSMRMKANASRTAEQRDAKMEEQ